MHKDPNKSKDSNTIKEIYQERKTKYVYITLIRYFNLLSICTSFIFCYTTEQVSEFHNTEEKYY